MVDEKMKIGRLMLNVDIPKVILWTLRNNARYIINYCRLMVQTFAHLNINVWQDIVNAMGERMLQQVMVNK